MYEFLSKFAQTFGLIIFVISFLLILIYALAPRNKEQFKRAARIPLEEVELDEGKKNV